LHERGQSVTGVFRVPHVPTGEIVAEGSPDAVVNPQSLCLGGLSRRIGRLL
jgi:hypothetical protein